MRFLVLLVAVALAALLWVLLAGGPSTGDGPRKPDPAEVELALPENLRYTRGSEVLTIWVKAPDRSVPLGAEVGIRHEGLTRWLYADEHGRRVFTDAPVGPLEAVARAPGFAETFQPLTIESGVPAETILVVRPATDEKPPR